MVRELTKSFHIFAKILIFSSLFGCSLSGRIESTAKVYLASLNVSNKTVQEFGVASLTVNLSKALSSPLTFTYYTQDQTAVAGTDYISVSGTATIPAGQFSVTISVPINDNMVKTENKKFLVQFSNTSIADIEIPTQVVEIQDDDYDPVKGYTKISTSSTHSCGLTSSGGVQCWGENIYGQLGDNSTTDRWTPVDVSGLTSGVASISTGYNFSCALTIGGGVKCWGRNASGQLGDNSTTDRLIPVDVSGLTSGVASISTKGNHACALTSANGVKCWGFNFAGQLGDNSTTTRLTPVDVSGLTSGVAAISMGLNYSCAVTNAGAAKCWGANATGQLGDNSTTNRLTQVGVSGLTSGVAAISANNNHTCALTTGGGVKCWGLNSFGQLGDNSTTNRLTPVDVSGLTSGIVSISTGGSHTCALSSGSGMSCWGANSSGQLGDGTSSYRLTFVNVSGLSTGVLAISSGESYTCALTTNNLTLCWGSNSKGQLGNNSTTTLFLPFNVSGLSNGVAKVSANSVHACALTTGGGVKCWGSNSNGQLGDNTTTNKSKPVDVSGLSSGVIAIATGSIHTCALTAGGAVKCWGANGVGQLGDNSTTNRLIPVDVSGLTSGVIAIAAGETHTCAATSAGTVKCWGSNANGQLGDNSTTQRLTPVDVSGLTDVIALTAGGDHGGHTCALTSAGAVKCWGANSVGQLGDNSTTQRLTPVDVSGLSSGIISISAGAAYTCAVTSSGLVKCWGDNSFGQLGDNSTTQRLTPVDVNGLTGGYVTVSTGSSSTCATTTRGSVQCWGANSSGQLGDNSTTQRLLPVDVNGLASGVGGVANGTNFTCVWTSLGGAKCWGDNGSFQLGNEYSAIEPQYVVSP